MVFLGQVLPLAIGAAARWQWPEKAAALEPFISRAANIFLMALLVWLMIDVWRPVATAGPRVAFAACVAALISAAIGHALGGPRESTRTALAISCCARNAGLALFVATANHASEAVVAVILAYVLIAALAITPYVLWRGRLRPA